MTVPFTTQSLQDALTAKLALNFGTEPGEATDQEMLKACALVLRDVMALRGVQTAKETIESCSGSCQLFIWTP